MSTDGSRDGDDGGADRAETAIGDRPEPDFETTYEYGETIDGLTVTIVDGLSEVRDVPPTEIVPRMNESVDPDALERIFRPLPDGSRRRGSVTFYLLDCRVTVDSHGTVRIYRE